VIHYINIPSVTQKKNKFYKTDLAVKPRPNFVDGEVVADSALEVAGGRRGPVVLNTAEWSGVNLNFKVE
jgi:hypothetical protein